MTMRLIPHAAAISEFCASYNGDCGETAEICALHVINPAKYALDSAELAQVVRRDINHGWASANGAEPISGIASDLALEGVNHTSYGFSQPARFDWRGVLHQWGGLKPLIFEFAQAGALPGDEAGVHFHFIACLGWDPDANTGVFADGDNQIVRRGRSGPAGLVRYTLANLEAAQVCGLIVAEYVLGEPPVMTTTTITIPTGWKDDGATLTAPNGVPVIRGFRDYILAHPNWAATNWPLAPEAPVGQLELGNPGLGGGSQQFFRGTVLEWRPAGAAGDGPTGVFQMLAGQELTATRAALATATSQLSAANGSISSLQQQQAALQQQSSDQRQQIATLQEQVATLQQQLSAPQPPASPPAAPTPPAAG